MEVKQTRRRRTAEERLADLERKRQEVLARQREFIAKIEAEKAKLVRSPVLRKATIENQRRFERAVKQLAPDWDHRHFIVLIQKGIERGIEADSLAERGERLLEQFGKARRGRRAKKLG
ncbi:hypothetical protein A5904_07980 [Acidithiobacillus caldus]|uniref:hypothetical protein n=1 Tax=Acidithiobacillus caldus TaxID=33059 RepID=UPI0007DA0C31|nr:hypothetical protein [Acidithiobacillus caldus]AUW32882.1 hypothetical protein A5904_07980 [Acidithiobacillus caldus]QER45530.1 hypothetical protein F0726_02475 [Acidithiobacillus caldus]